MTAAELLVFGSRRQADEMAATLNRMHARIRGTLREDIGIWSAGTPYRADDPDALLWVLVTLLDTSICLYEACLHRLDDGTVRAFLADGARLGAMLGVPAHMVPGDRRVLAGYIGEMIESRTVQVSATARTVAADLAAVPAMPGLAGRTYTTLTSRVAAVTLPAALRAQYGALLPAGGPVQRLGAVASASGVLAPAGPDAAGPPGGDCYPASWPQVSRTATAGYPENVVADDSCARAPMGAADELRRGAGRAHLLLTSFNVNGLRAAMKRGLAAWIAETTPHVLCLQEIRIAAPQLTAAFTAPPGYHCYWNHGQRPGYSGTALLSRIKPLSVQFGLSPHDADPEGRVIIAEYADFTLVNCYVPSGAASPARFACKLAFYEAVLTACTALLDSGRHVIVCGAVNAAHQRIDLANPLATARSSGSRPANVAGLTGSSAQASSIRSGTCIPTLGTNIPGGRPDARSRRPDGGWTTSSLGPA